MLPLQVAGRVDGLRPDAELAVAVNGRVAATTRAYPARGPAALRRADPARARCATGPNAITVLEVLPGDRLRTIGTAGDAPAAAHRAAAG